MVKLKISLNNKDVPKPLLNLHVLGDHRCQNRRLIDFERTSVRIIVCVLMLFFIVGFATILLGCSNVRSTQSNDGVEEVTCERVVDGDTLIVNTRSGNRERVRLIGIDAPESVSADESKNCEEGVQASNYMKSLVHEGKTLWLTRDVSDTDKYDRLLRFVWLECPSDNPTDEEITDHMLNAVLVANGYAQAKDYKPDTSMSRLFKQLGREAINKNLGVTRKWSSS